MELALMIAHLVFSVILIVVVLLQKSKQAGLSGAVGGNSETFFGKNGGRTVDAILKKLTGLFAILFIITSLALAFVATRPEEAPAANNSSVQVQSGSEDVVVTEGDAEVNVEAEADAE